MDRKAMMQRFYDEVLNAGNVEAMRELCTPGFIDHNPDPGQEPTLEGVIASFRQMRAAFPDMAVTVHDMIAEGDKVVSRVTMTATHEGDFQGIPATGKQISVDLIDMVRFEGDRAVERWGQYDALGFMQQLGALSLPA